MKPANLVVFNTIVLYSKTFITMGIALFATRIILAQLGVDDYGIFVVVGGIIGMLSFLNSAMAASTQRHLSFSMGTKDHAMLRKVFANSLILHFLIGLAVVILLEVAGLYLLNNQLKIAPERMEAANILFQFVVLSTFIEIIAVPYDGVVNAHENMLFVAVTNIIDAVLRLLIAVCLVYTNMDKLLVFGFLLLILTILVRIIKRAYCRLKYAECKVNLKAEADKKLIRELTSFAGWNLFRAMSGVLRNQGISVVMNLFFGTFIVAAYGIASQVNNKMLIFTQTMMQSLRPQIIKSEGAGNRDRLIKLTIIASRFSFYIYSILFIPIYIEMHALLNLWLVEVPPDTIVFCRFIMILTLINQFSQGIMTAVQSIGLIKVYMLVVGSTLMLTLPIGYILLRFGLPAYSILAVAVLLESISLGFRIIYFKHLTGFKIQDYFIEVVLKPLLPFLPVLAFAYLVSQMFDPSYLRITLVFLLPIIIYLPILYFKGLNEWERTQLKNVVNTAKKKVLSNTKNS